MMLSGDKLDHKLSRQICLPFVSNGKLPTIQPITDEENFIPTLYNFLIPEALLLRYVTTEKEKTIATSEIQIMSVFFSPTCPVSSRSVRQNEPFHQSKLNIDLRKGGFYRDFQNKSFETL